jgi:hypothetical protein
LPRHIRQPGQIAAQRRVYGAHETYVGGRVWLTRSAAGLAPDHTCDDERCPGDQTENPATTSSLLAGHTSPPVKEGGIAGGNITPQPLRPPATPV